MKRNDVDEHFERGRTRRKQLPCSALSDWNAKSRKHDPLELLKAATHSRVQALVPLKRQRMCLSPFDFFRGAAPVMAYDLSLNPHTEIESQLCGDAHVQNLGAFTGDDGRLIFDINDFDETMRGPFEWDLKRMATSLLLAGGSAGLKANGCRDAVETFLHSYFELTQRLSELPVLAVARFQVHRLKSFTPISKILRRAERATPAHSRAQLTEKTKSERIFRTQRPLLWRVGKDEKRTVLASLERYNKSLLPEQQHFLAQFRPLDVAFKIVGTGSIGLRDYCVYLEGNGSGDPLFLQVKQEVDSAYAPYLPKTKKLENGRRVVEGQRAMQLQSDPLLGWTSFGGWDFLVRQLNDHKASLDVTTLKARGLSEYAQVCGEMLARGHARSGNVQEIAGYLGGGGQFRKAIMDFAASYAQQTVSDWRALVKQQKTKSSE